MSNQVTWYLSFLKKSRHIENLLFYSLFENYRPTCIGVRVLVKNNKWDLQVAVWSFNTNTLWQRTVCRKGRSFSKKVRRVTNYFLYKYKPQKHHGTCASTCKNHSYKWQALYVKHFPRVLTFMQEKKKLWQNTYAVYMGLKMPRQLVIGPKGLLRTVAQGRYITQCIPLKHAMMYYIKKSKLFLWKIYKVIFTELWKSEIRLQ